MATYTKFNQFVDDICEKKHNLATDQLRVALTNSAPSATNTVLANITQISYTNLSSRAITTASASQTGGTFSLVLNDLVLTSSGGTTGPFRYVVIFNDTATNDELIAYYDYGTSITLQDGDTFTVDFGANLFTLA